MLCAVIMLTSTLSIHAENAALEDNFDDIVVLCVAFVFIFPFVQ